MLDQGRIQQIGAPLELYDHPANRFVATFLGTANLIEGTIDGDGRFRRRGDFALAGVGGAAGPACISIRPQDMALAPPGSGIAAKVAEREFLGGHTRYRVQASGHAIVVDVPHRRGGAPYAGGAAVGLIIDAEAGGGAALTEQFSESRLSGQAQLDHALATRPSRSDRRPRAAPARPSRRSRDRRCGTSRRCSASPCRARRAAGWATTSALASALA